MSKTGKELDEMEITWISEGDFFARERRIKGQRLATGELLHDFTSPSNSRTATLHPTANKV
jgi:hypothetical protein